MRKSVRQLLEAFLGKLPAGAANVSEGVDDSANKYLEVYPRNPLAAKIRVLDEDSGEYVLGIGRGTIIEVALAPAKRSRFGPASAEEIFLNICNAVANGEFEEKVSGILGKDLFVYGRINVNGCALRSFSGIPLIPYWTTLRYEPY
jgi:hypothetical protein